jgi:peptidoglycan/LPS O-acetylase OafA/YrhL
MAIIGGITTAGAGVNELTHCEGRENDVNQTIMTVLAFLLPLGSLVALRPKESDRRAQIRAAVMIIACAIASAAAINASMSRPTLAVTVIGAALLWTAGAVVILRGRRQTRNKST